MKKGFIIANENEEFVSSFKNLDGSFLVLWCSLPGDAQVFTTTSLCRHAMKLIHKNFEKYDLWELGIFENERNFLVTSNCSKNPPWWSTKKIGV